jgi:membrane-associated phospholipid phosphatase
MLVGFWIAMCAVVLTVGWLLTHPLEGSVGAFDDDVARWFAARRTAPLNDLAAIGTFLGDTVAGMVGLALVAVGFAFWQRSWTPLRLAVLVKAGLWGFYVVAVSLVPRPRPPVEILDPGLVPDHSFPSGHVATAIAIFGCTVVLTWTYARSARWWVTPLLVLPLCTLLARLYQGAHHLTDVLSSLVFASIWTGVVALVLLGWAESASNRRHGGTEDVGERDVASRRRTHHQR